MIPVQVQCFLYADEIVLVADSPGRLQVAVEEWTEELRRRGLAINPDKSKVMHVGRKEENLRIVCDGRQLEIVDDYLYLGNMIRRDGKIDPEVLNKVKKG